MKERERRDELRGGMASPLPWDLECGDVVLRRVPDVNRGLDTAGELVHVVQTNVPWSVIQYSLGGFEWGYGGSGTTDLALNILNAFVPPGADGRRPEGCWNGWCSATAWELRHEFTCAFLASLPWEGGVLEGELIREWIAARRETPSPEDD